MNLHSNVFFRFSGHKADVTSLTVLSSPLVSSEEDVYIVSGSKDNTVKIWSLVSGICVQTISDFRSEIWCIKRVSDRRCVEKKFTLGPSVKCDENTLETSVFFSFCVGSGDPYIKFFTQNENSFEVVKTGTLERTGDLFHSSRV